MRDAADSTVLATLLDIALDLCANLAADDRNARLLRAVRRIIPCDAAAILRLDGDALVPLASEGLLPDVAGRSFRVSEHPRLARILAQREPTRFCDDSLPDPFDGLLTAPFMADVHSCMGCALVVEGEVVGVLTCDAVAAGAFDAVPDRLVATVAALAATAVRTGGQIGSIEQRARRCGQVVEELRAEATQRAGGVLLGTSAATERVRREIELTAGTDLAVLVTGETGVGKELVARAVHARSARARGPLLYVNCAALPETIAESELFGHVRGAFTGATDTRSGKFEAADGGTLFLDEIGELPLSIQPKLLRALQTGEIQRVGSDRLLRVDARIVAATNRDLDREVEAGRFRADLFHRLSVFPIHVPPLRDRLDDVPVLTARFLETTRTRLGVGPVCLADGAAATLLSYDWPGNVRELEHTLLRAALRASAGCPRGETVVVAPEHLRLAPPPAAPPPAFGSNVVHLARVPSLDLPLRDAVDAFQRQRIRAVVEACDGNWAAASRQLGLDRGNLHRLARRLGLRI